jgi:hypothetical protein
MRQGRGCAPSRGGRHRDEPKVSAQSQTVAIRARSHGEAHSAETYLLGRRIVWQNLGPAETCALSAVLARVRGSYVNGSARKAAGADQSRQEGIR